MKYCPEENFTQLADAIQRIESHIGLKSANDNQTVNGRLNNISTSTADAIYDNYIAGEILSGNRIVIMGTNGKVFYADHREITHYSGILGLTTHAALLDEQVKVQSFGEMLEPSWNWELNKTMFLSEYGQMTQVRPISGILIPIGFAIAPTIIRIDIEEGTILS